MKIIDAHLHLYNNKIINHSHLEKEDPLFTALLGDYSTLPKKYLWETYQHNTASHTIDGIVWHEFVSNHPEAELEWASNYLKELPVKSSMVAKIDFSSESFAKELEEFQKYPKITAIRQHMAYHPTNPLKQFTQTPNYFDNPQWIKNLKSLKNSPYKCGLEIFSNQMDLLKKTIHDNSDIDFTIALLGWPYNESPECFSEWKKNLLNLKSCDNICFGVDGFECIFNRNWTISQVKPWLHTLLDIIGIERCMFGSHSPICNLSMPFSDQMIRYEILLPNLSEREKALFYHDVAQDWFAIN